MQRVLAFVSKELVVAARTGWDAERRIVVADDRSVVPGAAPDRVVATVGAHRPRCRRVVTDQEASPCRPPLMVSLPHSAPSPDYLRTIVSGEAQLYLAGWLADFPDPQNFFGNHFQRYQPQFGFRNRRLFALVDRADAETNLARRARLYEGASRLVAQMLPIVPYVHVKFAVALRRNVTGYVPGATGPINESFANVGLAPS